MASYIKAFSNVLNSNKRTLEYLGLSIHDLKKNCLTDAYLSFEYGAQDISFVVYDLTDADFDKE